MANYNLKSMLVWTMYLAMMCAWFLTKSHIAVACLMLVTCSALCFSAAMAVFTTGQRQRLHAAFALSGIAFLVFDTTGSYALSTYLADIYQQAILPDEMSYRVDLPRPGSATTTYTVIVPQLGDIDRDVFRCALTVLVATCSTLIASHVTKPSSESLSRR